MSSKMIFVLGNSRSGTTLMAQVLGRNADIFTFHELHFFEQLWKPGSIEVLSKSQAISLVALLLSIQRDDYLAERMPELYETEAEKLVTTLDELLWTPPSLYRSFLQYEVANHQKSFGCEQTPRNLYYLDEILEMFPDAIVINMVRDPRSVLLSQKNKWRIRSHGAKNFPVREVIRAWVNYHPITISLLWKSAAKMSQRYMENPRVKTVKFEDFVSNPELAMREICVFSGVEFNVEMLNVSQNEGGVSSLKSLQNKDSRGIDKLAANSWQRGGLSSTELMISQVITGQLMQKLGYTTTKVSINPLALFAQGLFFPVHLLLAFAMNFSRAKSIVNMLKRRFGH